MDSVLDQLTGQLLSLIRSHEQEVVTVFGVAATATAGALIMWYFHRRRRYHSGLSREVTLFKNSRITHQVTRQPNGSSVVVPHELDSEDDCINYSSPRRTRGVRLSKTGPGSFPAYTVPELFDKAVARCGQAPALKSCTGDGRSWREYHDLSVRVGRALMACGLARDTSCNIIGFNCPEWLIIHMGTILAGGLSTGVYTSNNSDACAYIAQHSRAVIVAVEHAEHLAKYSSRCDADFPHLRALVCWTCRTDADLPAFACKRVKVYSWESFLALAADTPAADLHARAASLQPGDTHSLIYTSGTTGHPKAVQITHDNVLWNSFCVHSKIAGEDDWSTEEGGIRVVSYLPLSHIAAQIVDVYAPLFATALMEASACTHFADANALKGTLPATLQAVRPTHFFGVPRVWEKIQAGMIAKGKENSPLRRKIVAWARSQGALAYASLQNGRPSTRTLLWPLARLLLKAVKKTLGLDRCRVLLTGAAPISPSVLEFFGSVNLVVLELFGMSETAGPATWSVLNASGFVLGSCGQVFPGAELMIEHVPSRDPVGCGEVCFRGRNIMPGYMGDAKMTAQTIDPQGWLRSGDVGRVDDDGMLFITGRIKELLISSGGENVPPVPIEDFLKAALPAVSNLVVIGDKRKFFVALVTPKCKPNSDGSFSNLLDIEAQQVDPAATTAKQASESSLWRAYVQSQIDVYNTTKATSTAQRIQKFSILQLDFSVVSGELGPTLKLKRSTVNQMHSAIIERMYEGTD